jgi:DNA-binding CsgD family transcriptional regulator
VSKEIGRTAVPEELFGPLGAVARQIGEPDFHRSLLELVGTLLPHETSWIVRYPSSDEPDVLYTKDICSSIVEYYLQMRPVSNDPYFCSWRANMEPRIETMAAALPLARDRDFYKLDFMKRMEFADEVAIYLPSPDFSCVSLFMERRESSFTEADIARLRRMFPMLLDFHKLHLKTLFASMTSAAGGFDTFEECAAAVFDRRGRLVFSTERWKAAEDRHQQIHGLRRHVSCADLEEALEAATLPLNVVPLDEMNPLGPGGLLVRLVLQGGEAGHDAATSILDQLTPRERDIVGLMLDGNSTGSIAQKLGIAKGSIKNCRLRMYRKFGVCSERALIAMMMTCASELKAQLAERGACPRSSHR